ncbi:hypothetical protein KBC59_01920 [Patescibacteria group bacterium]|nr:hypothetical protein [Patescibacteria group bacterium]
MPAPVTVSKQTQLVIATFHAEFASLPYFLLLLEPLMENVPDLLERPSVRNAFLACTLVDRAQFANRSARKMRIPKLKRTEIFLHWEVAHEFWFHRRQDALFVSYMNGTRVGLWPFLESALRNLEPDLPQIVVWDFSDATFREILRRNPRTWIFLSTVASLIKVLTKA